MWVSLQDVLAGMSALQDLTLNLQFADAIDDGTNHGLCRLTGGPSLSSMSALTRLELGLQPILPGPGEQVASRTAPDITAECAVVLCLCASWAIQQDSVVMVWPFNVDMYIVLGIRQQSTCTHKAVATQTGWLQNGSLSPQWSQLIRCSCPVCCR